MWQRVGSLNRKFIFCVGLLFLLLFFLLGVVGGGCVGVVFLGVVVYYFFPACVSFFHGFGQTLFFLFGWGELFNAISVKAFCCVGVGVVLVCVLLGFFFEFVVLVFCLVARMHIWVSAYPGWFFLYI